MNFRLNLILLGGAIAVWYAFLRPKKSPELVILETIPAYQQFKKKALQNGFFELAKIGAVYFALTFTPLARIAK